MTLQQIAERAGVSRTAVSNWRGRYADFPAPVPGSSGRRVVFVADEVDAWLAGRGLGEEAVRDVSTVLTDLVSFARLAGGDTLGAVATCLGLLAAGRAAREDAGDQAGAEAFTDAAEAEGIVAAATRLLRAQEDRGLAPTGLSAVLGHRNAGHDEAFVVELRDVLLSQDAVDFERVTELAVQGAFARLGSSACGTLGHPESVSSSLLAEIAATGLGDGPATVLDPACGTGDTLLRLAKAALPGSRVYGNEIEPALADITRVRLWLHDIDSTITVGNALEGTVLAGVQADVLVTEPPMGMRLQEIIGPSQAARDLWGVSGSHSGEAAFVIDAVSRLSDEGTAYVLVPTALLSATSQARLREQLVARGMLQAVIELPRKILSYSAIGTSVLILRSERSPETATAVTLIDATAKIPSARQLVRALRAGATDVKGLTVGKITMADLLDDTSLQPSVRLATPMTAEQALEGRRKAAAAYDKAIEEVENAIEAAEETHFVPRAGARTVTLTDLIDDGTLRLVRCHGGVEVHEDFEPSAKMWPVNQDDMNRDQNPPGTSWRRVETGPDFESLLEGDIIVPLVGNNEAYAMPGWVSDDPYALSQAARALRIENPRIIDPRYLKFCLNAPRNQPVSTSNGVPRRALKDITIPLLSLEEQKGTEDYLSTLQDLADKAGNTAAAARRQLNATLDWLPFA